MDQQHTQKKPHTYSHTKTLSFIPLGGIEDVTKNMYVYEYENEILLVDCGIGFADETMLGVDLMLPDISYLLQTKKKIVGMVISHGHEDHMGALPFILPQLPNFPIYASPFTAALANEKLKGFQMQPAVQAVAFDGGDIKIGSFTVSFIRITHSVPDTANIFIKTPAGNFYHGSDFKFDLTPADGQRTDFQKITQSGREGILCLFSDCLGSERAGHTPTEEGLDDRIEQVMKTCKGKFLITTYSSHVARLNQIIAVAERLNRKVCFIGRSLVKVKTLAQKMGYLKMKQTTEIEMEKLGSYPEEQIVLIVAGSQGQENSALTRIATGEHREIKLMPNDAVLFSSDPIPGNEVSVSELIDTIVKRGAKAYYAPPGAYHVSGHGSVEDLKLMISLTQPKFLLPISGSYKQMVAYKGLGEKMGYSQKDIMLIENGQEVLLSKEGVKLGRKFPINNVYVDQVSGEEVDSYVLRDREKLAKDGIVIIMAEVTAADGQLLDRPEVVARGFSAGDSKRISTILGSEIQAALSGKKGKVDNWVHLRKKIGDISNRVIFKELRRRPLVLPVVIEV